MHKPAYKYQRHVHRAVNYMALHLDRDVELDELAQIAGFSRFHFHRLFRAVMGEPVFHLRRRLRIEEAASQLLVCPDAPVADVAHDCGFKSSADFARVFRLHFGRSAREWRADDFWWFNDGRWEWRSREKFSHATPGETEPACGPSPAQLAQARNGKRFEQVSNVRVCQLPGFRVAYLRQIGPYQTALTLSAWQRFARWAVMHGMVGADSVGILLPRDNQFIVAPEHFRLDAGMIVDRDYVPDALLDTYDVLGGDYLIAEFVGRLDDDPLAGEYLWQHWMRSHALEQAYGPVFRRFRFADWNPPALKIDSLLRYEICIPIKPLGAALAKPEITIEPLPRRPHC
jgi:AraC family transcriptional regulator